MSKRRSPSPSPTVVLDISPKQELIRSASEDSLRVVHHAVIFPNSPVAGRVTYIRRLYETDSDLVRRQLAAIALQPLTFAEELAAKRKQLEMKAEKRKREKAAQAAGKDANTVPEIMVAPPSGEKPKRTAVKEKSVIKSSKPVTQSQRQKLTSTPTPRQQLGQLKKVNNQAANNATKTTTGNN